MAERELIRRRTFATNDVIFEEDQIGHDAYVVETGSVEISKSVAGRGEPLVLGMVGPGGIFGEMALIDKEPRMARAKAMEPTTLIVITETSLQALLGRSEPFVRHLLTIFVCNIRSLTDMVIAKGGPNSPALASRERLERESVRAAGQLLGH